MAGIQPIEVPYALLNQHDVKDYRDGQEEPEHPDSLVAELARVPSRLYAGLKLLEDD